MGKSPPKLRNGDFSSLKMEDVPSFSSTTLD